MAEELRAVVNTNLAPPPECATSQCIAAGGMLFLSAQTGKIPDGSIPGDFLMQMKNAMYNCRAILEAAGSDFTKAIRVSIAITDGFYMEQMEEIYKFFFPTQDPPARDVVVVSSLPKGALVQVTVTAIPRMSF